MGQSSLLLDRPRTLGVLILLLSLAHVLGAQQTFFHIDFVASDIAYNPSDQMLYASVPSYASVDPNSVVPIDPNTGNIGTPIFLGNDPKNPTNPNLLAISGDGQYLYVGLDGIGNVSRINLKTQAPDLQFSLGMGRCGMDTAGDMQVLPGNPHSVAVARRNQFGCIQQSDGVVVYDDAVARPNIVTAIVDSITFGANASVLYGKNTERNDFELTTMTIDASGLTLKNSLIEPPLSPINGPIIYDNGLIYSPTTAFDPASGALVGEYKDPALAPFGVVSAIRPDSASNRVFALGQPLFCCPQGDDLLVYNQSQFTEIGNIQIPQTGGTSRILRWGSDGVAILQLYSIYMFHTPFLASQPTLTSLSTSNNNVQPGDPVTFTAQVTPPTATGSVDFKDGGNFFTTVPLTNGVATYTTNSLSEGSHVINASYSGDNTYQASSSMYVLENVFPAIATGISSPPFLSLIANDLAYNPFDGMLYASLPGGDGPSGNSIVAIDPLTGRLGTPIPVGSEPGHLAISDDGRYLYVELAGERAIRRFNLLTQAPEIKFSLGRTECDGLEYGFGGSKVVPGAPHSIAVIRSTNCGTSEVAIYDDGVPRPNAAGFFLSSFTFGATSDVIYALADYNSPYSGNTLFTMHVSANGVTEIQRLYYATALKGDISFDKGLLYDRSAIAADPATGATVGGFFDPGGIGEAMTIDPTTNRVYLLAESSATSIGSLGVFDESTFTERGRESIAPLFFFTAPYGQYGVVTHIVPWGNGGIAFNTQSQIFLAQSPVPVKPTATVLTSSLNPAQPAQMVTFTAEVDASGSTPYGMVTFQDFGSTLAVVPVSVSGLATFSTTALSTGPHLISANYSGTPPFSPSASNRLVEIIQTSAQAGTSLGLTLSQNPAIIQIRHNPVVLAATVTTGAANATGAVLFYDGAHLLGSAPLDASGQARFTAAALTIGPHAITAAYGGDPNFAASVSPTIALSRSPRPH